MTKKEAEAKKEAARALYMEGHPQKVIAQKIGVSEQTISKWVDQENWAVMRAGVSISRPELVKKTLGAINKLLDQVYESQDPKLICTLPDQLSKFASFIAKLDQKTNVVTVIDVFIAFSKWIRHRATFDPEITPEFLAALDRYQDMYINETMSKNGAL
jgi:hypothetical protein